MKRDKAIEVMDLLIEQGYRVTLTAIPIDNHHQEPAYWVALNELGVDRIDLKHLVAQAEKLELDVGLHSFGGGGQITFSDEDSTPVVIRNPRRHPK